MKIVCKNFKACFSAVNFCWTIETENLEFSVRELKIIGDTIYKNSMRIVHKIDGKNVVFSLEKNCILIKEWSELKKEKTW